MIKLLPLLIVFSAYSSSCPVGYLCATGCGLHESEADAQARSGIGKVFKVKIESQFTSARADFGSLDESYAHEVISEEVEQNLEGVVIKDRREEDGEVCATAQLNKTLFTQRIRDQISQFNKESKNLVASGRKLVWERVRENNSKIKQLSSLLSVIEIDGVSSILQVPAFKKEKIKITFEGDKEVEDLKKLLEARVLRNGFLNDKSKNNLEVKLSLKKVELNISGFEKFELDLLLTGNYDGRETKAFKKFVAHGRSKDQVVEKINKQLLENLSQLFIDISI